MKKLTIEIEQFENLKKELIGLRKLMDFKNNSFCKKKLESIIENYFEKKRK